jgi:hypothetical protein
MPEVMKKAIAGIYALFILGFTSQAQTADTVKNNLALRSEGNKNTPEEPGNVESNFDSLCYRSDTEIKRISKKRVPEVVLNAFDNNFIHHKKEQWRLDLNTFAVDFTDENKEQVSAYYNSKGELLEYITLKENKNMDPSLLNQINAQLRNSKITEVMEVKRVRKNQTFFVVNTVDGRETSQHYLDADGKLME